VRSEASARPERRPGRPRDPATNDAILRSVEQLLARDGYDALTIDAVARHAGVGRPTIYRRWPDKAHLVLAALSRTRVAKTRTDTGSLRGDLLAIHRYQERLFAGATFQAVVPPILARLGSDPLLHQLYESEFVELRRHELTEAIDRAWHRGELPSRPDPFDAFDLLTGPLFYRVVVRNRPPTATFRNAVVNSVVNCLTLADHG
jgi:AcrR family transcriptional regulator